MDTLQHFCFTFGFLSNDFFLSSQWNEPKSREKIQQNSFSQTHVFKNKDCYVKKS